MLAIDHLIIAAQDPKQAADDFQRKHHVKVMQGGKHEKWGTYNYLAYLANDCYIEWIGIFDEERAQKSTNPLIQQLVLQLNETKEGLFQLAFRTNNMNQFVSHFNTETIPYKGPVSGSRVKPDGSTLAWKMLFPQPNKQNKLYPFLIEWSSGINKPAHKRDISNLSLKSITIPDQMINQWNDIYCLYHENDKIKLTNGELHLSQDEQLEFTLMAK